MSGWQVPMALNNQVNVENTGVNLSKLKYFYIYLWVIKLTYLPAQIFVDKLLLDLSTERGADIKNNSALDKLT